jgi:hypothetical protein
MHYAIVSRTMRLLTTSQVINVNISKLKLKLSPNPNNNQYD